MALKEQITADLAIFFNNNELADQHTIELEDVIYNEISAIVEKTTSGKYEKQWDGVYNSSLTIFMNKSDIARKPIRGQLIILDGKQYNVAECIDEMGMLEIRVEVPDV